jgi:cell division protein FtsQ
MPKANVPVLKEATPKKKPNKKIVGILILLFLSLLCVLFFRSSLSEVSEVTFKGNTYTTSAELLEISGIKAGDAFFGVSTKDVHELLLQVPSIEKVTVNKSFPGLIEIEIKEYALSAYQLTKDGKLIGLLGNGTKIDMGDASTSIDKPILTGWADNDPNLAKLCTALGQIPDDLTSQISEITPSPTVSYPDRIRMYTRSQFVVITAVSLLASKAEYMNAILEVQDPGTLKMLEADSYVPFDSSDAEEEGQNDTTHE